MKLSIINTENDLRRVKHDLQEALENKAKQPKSPNSMSSTESPNVHSPASQTSESNTAKELHQRDEDLARVLALYAAEQTRTAELQVELEAARKALPRGPKPPPGAPPPINPAQAQAHREQLSFVRRDLDRTKASLAEEKEQSRVAARRLRVLAASVVSLRAELARSREMCAVAEGRSADAVTLAERLLADKEAVHESTIRAARIEAERVAATLRSRISALEEMTTRSSDTGARLMNENKSLLVRACAAEAAQEELNVLLATERENFLAREAELRDEALSAKASGTQRGLSAAELRKQLRREVSQAQRLALQLRVCVETHPDLASIVDRSALAPTSGSGSGSSGLMPSLAETEARKSSGGPSAVAVSAKNGSSTSVSTPGEIVMLRDLEALRARVAYLESSNSLLQSDLEEKKALAKSLMSDIAMSSASTPYPIPENGVQSKGHDVPPATPTKVSKRKQLLSYIGVSSTQSQGSAPGGSPRQESKAELEARSAQTLLLESAVRTERMKTDMSLLGEQVDSLLRQVKTLTNERDELKRKLAAE